MPKIANGNETQRIAQTIINRPKIMIKKLNTGDVGNDSNIIKYLITYVNHTQILRLKAKDSRLENILQELMVYSIVLEGGSNTVSHYET
ncbi:MAG: hypothetical protein HN687_08930 [Candidatus Marinimicrobia bacterium]|nr:hypothetical protein [Candidatus Neomarinimicrobiota bacterium]